VNKVVLTYISVLDGFLHKLNTFQFHCFTVHFSIQICTKYQHMHFSVEHKVHVLVFCTYLNTFHFTTMADAHEAVMSPQPGSHIARSSYAVEPLLVAAPLYGCCVA